jgi:hypothetical protein
MDYAGLVKKIFLFDFFAAQYYITNMGEVVDGMTNGLLKLFDHTNNEDVKKMIKYHGIITVKKLLEHDNLRIPIYQRPYKWTEKNVNQLIDDVLFHSHKKKSAYRLGTLIIYEENGEWNIVDGQQRTITLVLIIHALKNYEKQRCTSVLSNVTTDYLMKKQHFPSNISCANIQNNYKIVERRVFGGDFQKDDISFLLNECEFVKIILAKDISEAFQFFDSQNARGKDLEPHDLLKAFHLREMNESSTEKEKLMAVKHWESMDQKELSKLFAHYLYRIRNWSKERSAIYFTKKDVDIFKGISPKMEEDYPFVRLSRIAHYYTENYNRFSGIINNNFLDYPFQIDQTIINGKRFFEMITHYYKLINDVKNFKDDPIISKIISTIKLYPKSNRIGDKYTRNLFWCGLIYYVDKFGFNDDLSNVVYMLFIWAYSLRLILSRVGLDSVDNYALGKDLSQVQLFKTIREAVRPNEILNDLNTKVKRLQKTKLKKEITDMEKDMGEVVKLFEDRNYL